MQSMACRVKDESWVGGWPLGGHLVCVFSPVTECAVPAGTLWLPLHPPEGEGDTHTSLKDFRGLRQTLCSSSRGVGRGLVARHGAIYLIQLSSSYPASEGIHHTSTAAAFHPHILHPALCNHAFNTLAVDAQ